MPYSTIQIHSQKLLDTWGDLSTFKTETKGKRNKKNWLVQGREENLKDKIYYYFIFKKRIKGRHCSHKIKTGCYK